MRANCVPKHRLKYNYADIFSGGAPETGAVAFQTDAPAAVTSRQCDVALQADAPGAVTSRQCAAAFQADALAAAPH
jgi:hypothetical protein